MKFSEEKLEKAFAELLGQEEFSHQLGIAIARKPRRSIDRGRFKKLPVNTIQQSHILLSRTCLHSAQECGKRVPAQSNE